MKRLKTQSIEISKKLLSEEVNKRIDQPSERVAIG